MRIDLCWCTSLQLQCISCGLVSVLITERRSRVVNTPSSYSGNPGFESRPSNGLSWLKLFVVFFSRSSQMHRQYLKLVHHRFLLHPLQFVIHISFFHSMLRIVSYWESLVKSTIKQKSLRIFQFVLFVIPWRLLKLFVPYFASLSVPLLDLSMCFCIFVWR